MFSHLLSISLNNTLSRGLHSSRRVTLQTWITTGPHSIWSSNGIRPNGHPAYVLSAEFRRIMRPIAFRIYDCLSRDGRGYQYPDFHKSIYIIDNKVFIPDPPHPHLTPTNFIHYHRIIDSFVSILDLILYNCPHPLVASLNYDTLNPIPVIYYFRTMCNDAFICRDIEKLKDFIYFITMNPLIYDLTEYYHYILKIWYIYSLDFPYFENNIKFQYLEDYPESVNNDDSTFALIYYNINSKTKTKINLNIKSPYTFYHPGRLVRYVGNVFRHCNPPVEDTVIINELHCRLPAFVPHLFYLLAKECCLKDYNRMSKIFGKGYMDPKSLINRLKMEPYIIHPNDKNFVDVKKVPAATAKPTPKKEPKTPVTPKVQPSEGSKTLFVGKLPFTVERAGIENVFKEVGEVVDIRFALHPEGGTKGYGHDKFASAADAKKVLENMNGLALFGRALKLGLAAERGAYTPQSRGFERNSFQRAEGVEGTSIFIHGLDTNDDEYKTKNALREHFGSCGEISGISVPKDPEGYIKGKEDDV